jgi:hypothetical protein
VAEAQGLEEGGVGVDRKKSAREHDGDDGGGYWSRDVGARGRESEAERDPRYEALRHTRSSAVRFQTSLNLSKSMHRLYHCPPPPSLTRTHRCGTSMLAAEVESTPAMLHSSSEHRLASRRTNGRRRRHCGLAVSTKSRP